MTPGRHPRITITAVPQTLLFISRALHGSGHFARRETSRRVAIGDTGGLLWCPDGVDERIELFTVRLDGSLGAGALEEPVGVRSLDDGA